MTTAAFWIAIAGLVLATVSLTWQVLLWTLAGARVKVQISRGFLTYTDGRLRESLLVTAVNKGREPALVTGWGLLFPDGKQMVFPDRDMAITPELPGTLKGLHNMVFIAPLDQLVPSIINHTGRSEASLRGFVHLATGKRKESKPLTVKG